MDDKKNPHQSSSKDPFYTPFDLLADRIPVKKKSFKQTIEKIIKESLKNHLSVSQPLSEEAMFLEEMKDVKPLDHEEPTRVPPPKPSQKRPRYYLFSEMDAYNQLMDLVSGEVEFDLYYTDEYVEGSVHGLPLQIVKKLRKGEFSYQDYLDLHGYTKKEAYSKVVSFINRSYGKGYRCVLIIPGRGLNSEGQRPVLKESLIKWLTQSPLKQLVLAFSSARAYDGGLGAFYVLLRRSRKKARFSVRNYPL